MVCYNKGVTICFRGVLAQLARALRWHRRGHEFESHILHQKVLTRTNLAKKYDWFEEVSIGVDLREKSALKKFDAVFLCFFWQWLELSFPRPDVFFLELVSKSNVILLIGYDLGMSWPRLASIFFIFDFLCIETFAI